MGAPLEQEPRRFSRREIIRKGIIYGGGLIGVGAIGDAIYGTIRTSQISDDALKNFPPPPQDKVENAQETILAFQQNQEELARKGTFGTELQDAYKIFDQSARHVKEREQLIKKEIPEERPIRDFSIALGGVILTMIGGSINPKSQKPCENGNLIPQSPSKGASSF